MPDVNAVSEIDQFKRDATVIARINADVRRRSALERARWFFTAASVLAGTSGWVMWAKYPRIETRIEYMAVAEDGTPLMALRDEEMPPEARKTNIQNSVINYVKWREGFNEFEFEKNYNVISRMSNKEVRDEYQSINGLGSATGQWKTYSGGGWVKVEFDSMEDLNTPAGYEDVPPAYLIRFCRQEKLKDRGVPEKPELWGATVVFKADVKGYDARLIRAYNPGKIQVTAYPNVRKIGPINNNASSSGSCVGIR